ncbi:MAG: response regulator [Deltaproteobacteria bacterium]|nr:response regulator [Deltaproteobacteria bacterium]
MKTLACLSLALPILVAQEGMAQSSTPVNLVEWSPGTERIGTLGQYGLETLLDQSMQLTFNDVQKPDAPFIQSNDVNPGAGYGQQNLWVRFSFRNLSTEESNFFLEAEYGFYDEIEIFVVRSDGSIETRLTGDKFEFGHRKFDKYTFVFPLSVAFSETVAIYLRGTSEELTFFPLHIHNKNSIQSTVTEIDRIAIGMTCAILIMLLYNLGLFLTSRDTRYFLFIFYGLANYFLLFTYLGLSYQYFWPQSTNWHQYSVQFFGFLQALSLLVFSRKYLDIPKQTKTYKLFVWAERFSLAGILVLPFLPQHMTLILVGITLAPGLGLPLFAAIQSCFSGTRHAYYFLAAFGVMTTFLLLNAVLAVVPAEYQTALGSLFGHSTTFGPIGFGLQLCVLSLGLGDRFNQLQKTNEAMTSANLERESKARQLLEHEVNKQTLLLREQNSQLQDLDRQKTIFFQNISHELRTPLTLILNPLEQVTEHRPNDPSLSMAMRNAKRLLRLVNQLLDFQKLDAGQKKITLQPLNILRFTHTCADYFSSACDSKNITFKVSLNKRPLTKETLDVQRLFVMGEVDAFEKVTFNYLSNAIKFTPVDGHIELGLIADGDIIEIFVRDTGPGIPEESQHQLFKTFSQIDGTASRSHEGTGLGLAYAKSLTQAMGGTVGVTSKVGQGSSFWARFPKCEEPDHTALEGFEVKDWLLTGTVVRKKQESAQPQTDTRGQSQTILVVDDLEDMRVLITETLKKRSYNVVSACDGAQGLERARKLHPDIIISDWMMPKMTGPELIKELKSDAGLSSTPVILLTAKSDDESKLLGTQIGADAFLGKPFNSAELLSMIHNLLKLKEREKEVAKLNRHITENVLKRYLPPNLIDDILKGRLKMEDEAQTMLVTLLFSDLSGFTAMSEHLGAEQMALLLNEYLTKMNEVIFAHGGTIDKFMGDGIMVIFGAPRKMPENQQAQQAVACGESMQRALSELCEKWSKKNISPVTMRVGIHQGLAIVGNFGSKQRSDYTAIGPTVNIASRIETSCAQKKVYISAEVAQYLQPGACTEIGDFKLKGIEELMKLYMVTIDSDEHPQS